MFLARPARRNPMPRSEEFTWRQAESRYGKPRPAGPGPQRRPFMTSFAAPLPSLKRHKPFALFWVMRVTTTGAYFMQAVAIGWQIYDMTGNPLDLGFVGLVQFFPPLLLAVVVGQIIDRYDRRAIPRSRQGLEDVWGAG